MVLNSWMGFPPETAKTWDFFAGQGPSKLEVETRNQNSKSESETRNRKLNFKVPKFSGPERRK